MTKKHFIKLARVLKNTKPTWINEGMGGYAAWQKQLELWENMCNQMADFCSAFNINFDRYRFLTACGVDEG